MLVVTCHYNEVENRWLENSFYTDYEAESYLWQSCLDRT